ncbi:DNA-binding protein [Anabaena sp. WA102]|uniref:HEPN domain-containing protein n=1 Tax=Anabaena sp. WA102 TaxID=1647413 RepID=UPI0006AC222C|nr:HEPN domain-containing protein [Anabaena sp. WA102]ALB40492.1 DNA-binding protein [Anabaena sp. WA102]
MQDSFSNSAGRHLQDAQILLGEQRWDNAVYLAGYVVECCFKVLVEQNFKHDQDAAKKYNHNLAELDGRLMERLRVIYPVLDKQLPTSRIVDTVLAEKHPDRRYFKSGHWTEAQATTAVQRAEEIYREIISKLVLDGSILSKDI